MPRQAFLVGAHQKTLTDRRTGLELSQIGAAWIQAEPAHPAPMAPELTSTTLRPVVPDTLELVSKSLNSVGIECAVRPGQHVGADFDDDPLSERDDLLAHRIDHVAGILGLEE